MLNVNSCNTFSRFSEAFYAMHQVYYFYSLYKLWESAISHLFALDRLRHGTSPLNFINIQIHGLAPETAAKSHGEATYLSMVSSKDCEPREKLVYVMKDRHSIPCKCKKDPMCSNFFLIKRKHPREYAYQSGAAMLAFSRLPFFVKKSLMMIGGIFGILTPTLQFHFDPQDLHIFESDPWLECIALRTDHTLSVRRLGLIGALKVGLNGRIVERVQENPQKVLVGVIQLIAAVGITLNLCKNSNLLQSDFASLAKLATIHAVFLSAI